jgi:hypothetical protein
MRQAARTIESSLQQNFVRQRAVIISVDCGAVEDDGADLAAESNNPSTVGVEPGNGVRPHGLSSLRTIHRVTARFNGVPAQGVALHTILASADLLRAKACAMVSPATSSFTADWVAKLLRPAFRDSFDFVAPLYTRHKFHGLLARNLLYPMSRALFGRRIHELFSDEWGFSSRLGGLCLEQDVWNEEAVRTRPEAWMGISATASDYRCCQVYLGQKPQPSGGAAPDIVEAMRQTVGTLFWCLEKQQSSWLERNGSEPVPTFGPDHSITTEPLELNRGRLYEMFQTGARELEPLLSSILTPETHLELKAIAALDPQSFSFGCELWVRILYDFASSYHHAVINRDHLVQALVPLYRGKIYSFLVEHADSSEAQIEADSENLCLEFERQKSYLREKWKEGVEVKS